ncbi:MAG: aminotransferase class V-fold PLP-dependent enzyme [Syntrophomonadaceae bacterium]
MKTIYLDNAATSYPKPEEVYRAVDNFNRNLGGNPGRGSNQQTLQAGAIILKAREALARLFNINDSLRIAFTLNITEALNTGLKGILKPGDHVVTTSMEHNSVARPLHVLEQQGIEWTRVPCSPDGSLEPEDVRRALKPNTRLICMLHASNVTGTIMPIREIGSIARAYNILFMVDSAQTAGILPIDVVRDNIDVLTFTGHKGLMGPQGTGGIYIGPELVIKPLKEGGTGSLSEFLEQPKTMPDLLESGTANNPGIAGLLAGIEFIQAVGRENIRNHETSLTGQLLQGLKEIKGVTVYGPGDSSVQTAVVAFNIEGIDCGDVCMRLDYEYGIITRSGLHCAPLAHQTMGTLELGTCRLSPGYFTTSDEIDQVLRAIHNIARQYSG